MSGHGTAKLPCVMSSPLPRPHLGPGKLRDCLGNPNLDFQEIPVVTNCEKLLWSSSTLCTPDFVSLQGTTYRFLPRQVQEHFTSCVAVVHNTEQHE